jgi:hypothetical protein
MLYNLFFHPLRKYPGPLLARATRWTWSYYLFQGTLEVYIGKAHDKYGDVVRVAPDELSYITGQAVSGLRHVTPQMSSNISFNSGQVQYSAQRS